MRASTHFLFDINVLYAALAAVVTAQEVWQVKADAKAALRQAPEEPLNLVELLRASPDVRLIQLGGALAANRVIYSPLMLETLVKTMTRPRGTLPALYEKAAVEAAFAALVTPERVRTVQGTDTRAQVRPIAVGPTLRRAREVAREFLAVLKPSDQGRQALHEKFRIMGYDNLTAARSSRYVDSEPEWDDVPTSGYAYSQSQLVELGFNEVDALRKSRLVDGEDLDMLTVLGMAAEQFPDIEIRFVTSDKAAAECATRVFGYSPLEVDGYGTHHSWPGKDRREQVSVEYLEYAPRELARGFIRHALTWAAADRRQGRVLTVA